MQKFSMTGWTSQPVLGIGFHLTFYSKKPKKSKNTKIFHITFYSDLLFNLIRMVVGTRHFLILGSPAWAVAWTAQGQSNFLFAAALGQSTWGALEQLKFFFYTVQGQSFLTAHGWCPGSVIFNRSWMVSIGDHH